jgi:ribosomal protein L11 methyltransferase
MEYTEISIQPAPEEIREILVSLLAEEGFESFAETGNGILAYVPASLLDRLKVAGICSRFGMKFTEKNIPDQNWNAEWEKNFEPVTVTGRCYIRAPFHPARKDVEYEILIEPKMSFGTAHHETTAMMIETMLEMDLREKRILDMGCGTGILAILADKMGAAEVTAVDNDEWAFLNASENILANHTSAIKVKMGDVDLAGAGFDVILANINRNVLLQHIPEYSKRMKTGQLLMSGFYEEDLPMILETAALHSFRFDQSMTKNRWVAALFRK